MAVKHWPGNWLQIESVLDIDWRQPWYLPWAQYGEKVQRHWQECPQQLDQALNLSRSLHSPKVFVPQPDLPAGVAYESFVFQHQKIPTRNNAHDFFNGLCWLRFPQTKTHLNRLQAQAIAAHGVGAQRGTLRDALTLFDENASLLCAPPSLWRALHHKSWRALFVTERASWQQAKLVLFGHALLEKLLHPYKGITAHVLCIPMPALQTDDEMDAWLCQQLTPERLHSKPFVPLPLAGIPGWWPGNEVPAFFEDKKVFRD